MTTNKLLRKKMSDELFILNSQIENLELEIERFGNKNLIKDIIHLTSRAVEIEKGLVIYGI